MRGDEQDVIERQRFPDDTHVTFSYAQKRIIPASARSENRAAPACDPPAGARVVGRTPSGRLTCGRGWITLPLS
jgi:hypothetical protein